MRTTLLGCCALIVVSACNKGAEPTTPPAVDTAGEDVGDNPGEDDPFAEQHADDAERPVISVEACEASGTVVGDIGDGAIHKADYVCENGQPPTARVESGIEGAVCCPNG